MSDKLQKVLANNGVGSRREMETWIQQDRISVNGAVAKLGDRVELTDQIRVDGNLLKRDQKTPVCRVLMYNSLKVNYAREPIHKVDLPCLTDYLLSHRVAGSR